MEKFDFSIQDIKSLSKSDDYVILQAGKGRNSDPIHVNSTEFSYVEGLIWDKHREFENKKKTKIPSPDWTRILEGFDIASKELSEFKQGDDIKDILKFELFNPTNPLKDILNYTDEIKTLLGDLTTWISNVVTEEKFVLIIKNHL